MKRFFICLLLFATALLNARAQTVIRWGDGIKDWTGIRISAPTDSIPSSISYTLLKEKKSVRTPGITYRYQDISAAIIPGQSYIRPDAMTESSLQTIRKDLDILEYYARRFREELLFSTNRQQELEQHYITLFREARDKAHLTGDYSPFILSEDSFDITQVPFESSRRFHGISLSLFTNIPLGDMGRLLYPAAGVSLSFGLGQNNSCLLAEIDYGLSLYRNRNYDLRENPVPYIGAFVQYRGALVHTERWNLSLLGGPGFTLRAFDHLDYRQYIYGPALNEGLCADLHLNRKIRFSSRRPELADTFLRFTLSCGQTYNPAQKLICPSINLAVGVYFQDRTIKKAER